MEFHALTRFSSFWRMLVKTRGHAVCVEVMWLFDPWCDFREVAWPCSDVTFGGVMWLRAGARTLHYITLHYITLHYIHTYVQSIFLIYIYYLYICILMYSSQKFFFHPIPEGTPSLWLITIFSPANCWCIVRLHIGHVRPRYVVYHGKVELSTAQTRLLTWHRSVEHGF